MLKDGTERVFICACGDRDDSGFSLKSAESMTIYVTMKQLRAAKQLLNIDDNSSGLFLVHEVKPGTYRPELLFSVEPDASVHMLSMLRYSTNAILEKAKPESVIEIKRHNKAVIKLTEKLFPGVKGDMVMCGDKKY